MNAARKLVTILLPLFLVSILIFTACAKPLAPVPAPAPPPPPAPAPAPSPVPTPAPPPTKLKGGLEDFTSAARLWEEYWYSRYNLGNLVMMSGMGITFMPDMEMMMKVIQMVDQGPEDGDHAMPPDNPALLTAVFAGGDPHYINPMLENPADFTQYRWDPEKMDQTLTPAAQAQTIIKEIEWAKFFHFTPHFGKPTDSFGANERFKGMVLNLEAKMQTQFALKNLMNADGFFVAAAKHQDGQTTVTDTSTKLSDQFQMLLALSDVSSTLTDRENYPLLFDEQAGGMFRQAADMLFAGLSERQPTSIKDLSWGTIALIWYAANTQDPELQAQAIGLITKFGDALVSANKNTITEKTQAIRGLIEAYRLSQDAKYLKSAADAFESLSEEYDVAHGIFASQTKYTIEQVAHVLGALNALQRYGGDSVELDRVEQVLNGFFESVVDMSGLQLSAPPVGMMMGKYETELPSELYYRYPTVPMPPMAGKPYGIAPVFASEVTFDLSAEQWAVTNGRFDTAGAMLASNEMIWFQDYATSGFPEVKVLKGEKVSERKAEGSADIKGFTFIPDTITISRGDTVTWTNLDSVPHTATGDDFDSGNLAKGQSWSHTFNIAGTFAYICTIHPYMHGEVVIVE